MNQTSEGKFDIRAEFRLVPATMMALGGVFLVGIPAFLLTAAFPHARNAPPLAVQVLLGLTAGSLAALFILLIGYVNRDAKRRGMNSVLWTLLVIVVPDAIGFIIYFAVRQPIQGNCPHCGTTVNPAFNFCPSCKFALRPVCPQCHRTIEAGARFCPYCAAGLKAGV